jgi:uncharacterized phage protein gp47/JayE
MPLSLEQLREPVTDNQETARLLDVLQSLGFNTSGWQPGSVQRTIVQMVGSASARWSEAVDTISRFGFNDSATGDALTAFSNSHYDNQRVAAIATEGDYTLTGGLVGPPYTIGVGDLIVSDASGRQYQNTTAGTVPAGGSVVVTIRALEGGTGGNVANGTITTLNTALAGVTGSNDPIAPASTWITTLGVDEEDDETLRARNTSKWATLNPIGSPADLYINLALTIDSDLRKVKVDDTNPRGSGTLDVYLARETATAQPSDVATVQAEFDAKVCITSDPLAVAATEVAQNVAFLAYIETAKNNAATQAAVEQAVTDFLNGLPIGGTDIGGAGFVLLSELITEISSIDGVVNVVMTTPTADVPVNPFDVVTVGTITPTYTNWP